jgi:hypothetical protein
MTTYKVAELEGALLDKAVAKVRGGWFKYASGVWIAPSTAPGFGGEPIDTSTIENDPQRLRAYVTSKLGEEIEL